MAKRQGSSSFEPLRWLIVVICFGAMLIGFYMNFERSGKMSAPKVDGQIQEAPKDLDSM